MHLLSNASQSSQHFPIEIDTIIPNLQTKRYHAIHPWSNDHKRRWGGEEIERSALNGQRNSLNNLFQ